MSEAIRVLSTLMQKDTTIAKQISSTICLLATSPEWKPREEWIWQFSLANLFASLVKLQQWEVIPDSLIQTMITFFSNDYYPYRQLTVIYDSLNEYNANLVNIKKLLYSKIYLNHYQYIWFSEKLRQLSEKTDIDDYTLQRWFDYYLSHGALNKSKINRFLADRFIKKEDGFEILSVDEFIHRQEYCARLETGKIHERVGNLEMAACHYTDMINDREYNYAEVYRRLVECFEKTGDDEGVRKAVGLYRKIPPRDNSPESDRYFRGKSQEVER